MGSPALTLREIAARLGGEAVGEAAAPLTGVATLESAQPEHIAFLANPRYRAQLATTRAGAVIVGPGDRDATGRPRIVCDNPYAYYARAVALFHPEAAPVPGIHPFAQVDAGAQVGASAQVEAFAVIGAGARVGEGVRIGAGCVLGANVQVGEGTRLHPHVTVYDGCSLGARCLVHSGAVIGADGFGMAREGGRWLKVPQVGAVRIGDDVEIGANTTIDRGALDDTVIEDGVKLDNQIQVAHNVPHRRPYRHRRLHRHLRECHDRRGLHDRRRRGHRGAPHHLRPRDPHGHDVRDQIHHAPGHLRLGAADDAARRMAEERRAGAPARPHRRARAAPTSGRGP